MDATARGAGFLTGWRNAQRQEGFSFFWWASHSSRMALVNDKAI